MGRMNIVTKTKVSAKELATVRLTVNRSEGVFIGKKMYLPSTAMSVVFNSRGAVNRFDRDRDCIVHPTKGKLYLVPKNVEKFITVI